ncbi:aquaporin [Microscilla marina]|uniref:MIP family channel protein n=1 Tax=Microscilla marina ATCC 23134 TaxID=313606 RepID=A1ZJC8_MICM2|nr:aquaporin [Microscilla marina]EAY29664.1 MIP family channel protein [Microscilla marina ATCC 23134]
MKKYVAEIIGTYALVFCGTGAIVINQHTQGTVTHAGIAVTFGLVVMALIFAFGKLSGAHINPAVSIAFALTDIFPKKELVPYITSQLIGALLASGSLRLMFPESVGLGETIPAGSDLQSFILEVILTYLLMLVILMVSQNDPSVSQFTAVAVGGVVLFEAWFAGPISGASMNPARSIAPAVASGNLNSLWVYLTAPILGAVLATFSWKYLK